LKKQYSAIAIAAGLLCTNYAQAETGVTADLGTTGIGAHVSIPLESKLNARFGLNYLSHAYSGDTSNVNYDFTLKLKTVDALLDYFPMDNGFRITGGIAYNDSRANGIGKPSLNGIYNLNGALYPVANIGTLNGNVEFRKSAPYLGIGWGNGTKNAGWGFSSDFGVLFQGRPKTSLTSSGCTLATTPSSSCDTLARDLIAENVNLADKTKSLQYFPVVRIGATYTF